MKKFESSHSFLAILLAIFMIVGLFPVMPAVEVVAEDGGINALDKEWAWPDHTEISTDAAVINAGLQYIGIKDSYLVLRMGYKAVVSPPTLHWIYFRFEPDFANMIESISIDPSSRKPKVMQNLSELTDNDSPYKDSDKNNIWRIPLDKPGEGAFTWAPVVSGNYMADFHIKLKDGAQVDPNRSYAVQVVFKVVTIQMDIQSHAEL